MEDMIFASKSEALQHLANLTGKKIKIAEEKHKLRTLSSHLNPEDAYKEAGKMADKLIEEDKADNKPIDSWKKQSYQLGVLKAYYDSLYKNYKYAQDQFEEKSKALEKFQEALADLKDEEIKDLGLDPHDDDLWLA
jgi:flagellar biosynthesis/type III secretory pathway protein FliH